MIRTQYYEVRVKGRQKAKTTPKKDEAVAVIKNVLFEFDSDKLRPTASAELAKVAAKLKTFPGVSFRVEGHASAEGVDVYNLDLSRRRAQAVVSWFSTSGGLDRSRFTAVGLGETKPLAPNQNRDGSPNEVNRRKNRRVEVHQVRPAKSAETPEGTGQEYNVDLTPDIEGQVTLEDEDGLIQQLSFTVSDSKLWTNALSLGMNVELTAGPTMETATRQFQGNIKKIEPTFTETGEIQLRITCYGKEWAATAREPRDLLYPSDNHPKPWARAAKLTGTTIITNIAKDAGLKLGSIKIARDVTYSREKPVRQHKQTDWAFTQELLLKLHATGYIKQGQNGDSELIVQDNTSLLREVGKVTVFYPLREAGQFTLPSVDDARQVQLQSASITLDPDISETGVGAVKTKIDPVTGAETMVKEEYNKESKQWENWILDEAALRRLPEAVRDQMISTYLAGNLDWEAVKPYFRRADVDSQSSREPEDNWREILTPTGELPPSGVGSLSYSPLSQEARNNANNWVIDTDKLGKLTPQERSRVMGLMARDALSFDNAAQNDALQYFRYQPQSAPAPAAAGITPGLEKPVPAPADDKKKKKGKEKRTTKRDAGFKIQASCYGHEELQTRRSYVVEGASIYSGVYYLYRTARNWGPDGWMMDLTFTR